MTQVLVINGPNLQQLGEREPEIYGKTTLAKIEQMLIQQGRTLNLNVRCFQSNSEGAIIDRIYQAKEEKVAGIIINPGAYTHTSIAIRDCLVTAGIPAVEVHLTNIYARESFRQKSYTSGVVVGQVTGFGPFSYLMALSAIHKVLEETEEETMDYAEN